MSTEKNLLAPEHCSLHSYKILKIISTIAGKKDPQLLHSRTDNMQASLSENNKHTISAEFYGTSVASHGIGA